MFHGIRDVTHLRRNPYGPPIMAVADELAGLTDFHGPTSPATLFRGVFEGDQVVPYLSQFLYKDIPAGPKVVY